MRVPDRDSEDPEERAQAAEADADDTALLRDGARSSPGPADQHELRCLLASASHELRSPLQSIQGFAELLSAEAYGALGREQHAFIGHILESTTALGKVLDACLELASLELVQTPLERALLDVEPALMSALQAAFGLVSTQIESRVEGHASPMLARLDSDALTRALCALRSALGSAALPFQAVLEAQGERLLLRVGTNASTGAPVVSVAELSQRLRTARSLIWLRLAAALLERQEGVLRVSEQLDYAEVRLRLSTTH